MGNLAWILSAHDRFAPSIPFVGMRHKKRTNRKDIMRKILHIITTAALLTLSTVPVSAAIYMKVDGVKGRVTAAGKEKWIELGSIQFLTAGSAKGTMNQPFGGQCPSRAPLTAVDVEINGEAHTLRNVQFSECQTVGETTSFTIAFSGCATHANTPDHKIGGGTYTPLRAPLPKTYDHTLGGGSLANAKPDATITGLTPARLNARLLSMRVRGNKATVIVAVPPSSLPGTREASSPSVSEIVVTKINDGASWSYSGAHVLYQDITIPASARGASRVVEMTIDFESMKGSRADYADPENPLPGGR
jgi:hypothetical protein